MMPGTTPFSSILSISPNLWRSTALDYPGQSTLSTTSVTLVQHLALGYCGAAACRPAWQEAEPDNATPGYYYLAQRVFCGEGDSLLPELYAQWWAHPSTQLDDLLLRWCRQHRPDFFPLLVMEVEGREQVDIDGEPLLYIPGYSARSCLLWAEALHSGALSPLSESFIARRLNYGAPAMSEAHSQHPYWLLYQVADSWRAPRIRQRHCYRGW